jgi:thioredoxin reductase (NADPH)
MKDFDVAIIGGGPAGLSAAIYTARAGLKTVVLERGGAGGQMATTTAIENYPGVYPVTGPELAEKMASQARAFGAEIAEFSEVTAVDFGAEMKIVRTADEEYRACAVIIALGAIEKKLGAQGEAEFRGKGVSYCATCDGPLFKGKKLIVVGGGNSALEEAHFLSRFASSVTIVHRRNEFRAENAVVEKIKKEPKITLSMNTVVESIYGKVKVQGVRLVDVQSGAKTDVPADGVFIYVGWTPNTKLFEGKLELDQNGYIKTDGSMHSSIPGVLAAGDVTTIQWKQIAVAVGLGVSAGLAAQKYIEGM